MPRLALLLVASCAVQVLMIPRHKRAIESGAKNAVTPAVTGSAAGATVASNAVPKRRAYEPKPEPKDLMKKKGKQRSTSSSSGNVDKSKGGGDNNDSKDSLDMKVSSSVSSSSSGGGKKNKNIKNKHIPKSTEERHGWEKWHRKCTKCPEDQKMKWRDPRIKWVCGAYQRARRSFKSLCMMHYRNCQDGTMFVPIHDHRCENSSKDDSQPHGEHFMYDYKAPLSQDSSGESDSSKTPSEDSSSDSSSA